MDQEARAEMQRLIAPRNPLEFDGALLDPHWVVATLEAHLTPDRIKRIERVLDGRTHNFATVVEGLQDTGNMAAIMRSAEAFGFQPFHVIATAGKYKMSTRTTQGANKWLDVYRWTDVEACIENLREQGYRVLATYVGEGAEPIESFDFTEKTALVFGNEPDGVSPELLELADARTVIPTPGFVESFNVSAAAAVCLHHAYRTRIARGAHGDLSDRERQRMRAAFYVHSTRHADKLLRHALSMSE
ncbi:MAG: RNA methyltransferase [Acidimicrobiia bacterium]|jgi:tRNA (guanosine-2'-O-)-methyltransferase